MKITKFIVLLLIACLIITYADTKWRGVHIKQLSSGTEASPPPIPPPVDSNGAQWYLAHYPSGQKLGGGHGYTDTIPRHEDNGDVYYLVDDSASLFAAAAAATKGDTIYVDDGVVIKFSTQLTISADSVILASGYGKPSGDSVLPGAVLRKDSIGYDHPASANMIYLAGDGIRVTGLQLRGSYSEYDFSFPRTDSFPFYPISNYEEYGIWIGGDSCEIDNNFIHGFGRNAISTGGNKDANIHNNFVHRRPKFYSYGLYTGQNSSVIYEANFIDHRGGHAINATGDDETGGYGRQEVRYNIITWHGRGVERHQLNEKCPNDYYHHNTFMSISLEYGSAVRQSGATAYDSVFIHNNWFWGKDSATCLQIECDKARAYDNSYTATYPDGLSGRIPTASITMITADSGNAPIVCSLSAYNSSDPDGSLKDFYWNFGDSLNTSNVRHLITGDTVVHTYNNPGVYLIELMVMDNEGNPHWTWDTVKVKPADGNKYLTFWWDDMFPGREKGYFQFECWLGKTNAAPYGWRCYVADIAGNNSYEQVIVDITDTLTAWAVDSLTLSFRLICLRDSSAFWSKQVVIDDIHIFGAEVRNGNVEWPYLTSWYGNINAQTDSIWFNEEVNCTYMYLGRDYRFPHSGKRALYIGTLSNSAIEQNDYGRIWQRCKVD